MLYLCNIFRHFNDSPFSLEQPVDYKTGLDDKINI